ncbi:hypothetical protein PF005_g7402 [Phytophthora fragariae]|uniref:Uncharacterized protein n=1 Tax=Phytophthora fragariae TaxID=53985 RepID=A0A6A3YKH4_9STRA|nr:hypothetical protein PF010_g6684 [Phytophthora fragariae]KAE9220663.1 hypothetical protein PF005_g7402 [Phytophthora fragariae]KAE9242723.1 hypothetical protein PF004_g6484 [Phytophthora fragariae]
MCQLKSSCGGSSWGSRCSLLVIGFLSVTSPSRLSSLTSSLVASVCNFLQHRGETTVQAEWLLASCVPVLRNRSLPREPAARKTSSHAAATTTHWHTWAISDRLGTQVSRDSRYYVEYNVSVGKTEGSWQPQWLLVKYGFPEYLELVDAYKAAAGPMTFGEYELSRPDVFSQAMGASGDGRCAFHALAHAVDALGIPEWYSDDIVNHFYRARAVVGNAIASEGVVLSTLWSFIRQVNRSARGAGRPQLCQTDL